MSTPMLGSRTSTKGSTDFNSSSAWTPGQRYPGTVSSESACPVWVMYWETLEQSNQMFSEMRGGREGDPGPLRGISVHSRRGVTPGIRTKHRGILDTGQVSFCQKKKNPVHLGDGAHFYRQKAPIWRCKQICQGSQLVNRGLRSPLPYWAVWLPGATLPTTHLYCSRGPPGSALHADGLASSKQKAVCFPGWPSGGFEGVSVCNFFNHSLDSPALQWFCNAYHKSNFPTSD